MFGTATAGSASRRTHRVAEQSPGEQVDDRDEVELAPLSDDLRHVARPDELGFLTYYCPPTRVTPCDGTWRGRTGPRATASRPM